MGSFGGALFVGVLAMHAAGAQAPAASVSVGFGVDTTNTDVRDVVHLVRAYLAQPDTSARTRGLWSSASARDRTAADLARDAYQGFPATVIGVTSGGPGDSVYVVKLLHARADSGGEHVTPLALERLYAVRAPGAPFRWQLSGAIARVTRGWEQRSVGRLTFCYAPGQQPNVARATHAARFVDSVATLFGVPAPAHLDVYLAGSMDEALRVLGLDFFVEQSGPGTGRGGRALPGAGIVLVGDPSIGEAYLHELVHAVLVPTIGGSSLLVEGVATWLGGSLGRSPHTLYALLRDYQAAHPRVTVADLVRGDVPAWGQHETDALYATSALVIDAVFRRGGIAGVRRLANAKGAADPLLAAIRGELGLSAADSAALDRWWRQRAARAGQKRTE